VIPETSAFRHINQWLGRELTRPECVVAHESGLLLVPNWTAGGGISVISPTGDTHHIHATYHSELRPNGIALEDGGTVLLAHMGDTTGGIYRLHASGDVEPVILHVDGLPMPPSNFVVADSTGRLWITVSTRKMPRADDYRANAKSGFIAVLEPNAHQARIVADGLGYTNECFIDEGRGELWVNETFGRRLTRFDISGFNQSVSLNNPTCVHSFGKGSYPDGLALDEQGHVWITSIVSNRIIRVAPDGTSQLMFEDSDKEHLLWTESAYANNTLGRKHLDNAKGEHMKNISNLAFAGTKRNKLVIGNLLGDSLPVINTDFHGMEMTHWSASLGELRRFL